MGSLHCSHCAVEWMRDLELGGPWARCSNPMAVAVTYSPLDASAQTLTSSLRCASAVGASSPGKPQEGEGSQEC